MDRLLYIIIYLLFFYKFPSIILLISLGLYILFYIKQKNAIDYLNLQEPIKPQGGDVLLFFSYNVIDPVHTLLYDGILNLPTLYPIRHYAIMLDDEYYVEARHPNVIKWDNFTKKQTNGTRLGKLKYVNKDWNQGPIYVIRTNLSISDVEYEKIKIFFSGKGYWKVGGCIGLVNKLINIINPYHKFCYTPEHFIKMYGKKLGPLII